MEGTVTEIHYLLPHSWVYIEVKDAKGGEPTIWALEATGPQGIFRNGVGQEDVKVGDKIKARCHLLRDGSPGCLLGFVTPMHGDKARATASSISGTDAFAVRYQVSGGCSATTRAHDGPSRSGVFVRWRRSFFFAVTPARAQLATAELNGRVTDASGAVLPGATVTVTQTATGLIRTVVTDGERHLSDLQPADRPVPAGGVAAGIPHLRADRHRAAGRRDADDQRRRSALGTLEETVTVEAAAPLVDVRSAGISDVVENERIVELPLQGRRSPT